MKPFGLAGKPRPEPCGCCWYTREDCPYVSAKQIYRRRQRKAADIVRAFYRAGWAP